MKLVRSNGTITISDNPGCLWFLGLFMALCGSVPVYGAMGGFTNYDELELYTLVLSFIIGSAVIAGGVWMIVSKAVSRTVIDRNAETVVHKSIGFKGKNVRTYKFADIKQFTLIEGRDSEGDPTWSLALELKNGEMVNLSSMESHHKDYKQDFVFEANTFIYKQMPTFNNKTDLQDESRLKIG